MVGADGAGPDEAQPGSSGQEGLVDAGDGAHHQGVGLLQRVGIDLASRQADHLAQFPETFLGGGHVGIDDDSHGWFPSGW